MADLAFPWLADVIRACKFKLDQADTDPSNLGYQDQEFVYACREEQTALIRDLTALDKNFMISINTSLSVTNGSRSLTLPTDLRFLRKVIEIDSSGNEVLGGEVWSAYWEDLGKNERFAIYLPDQNILHFTKTPSRTYPVKIVYGYYDVPLMHGLSRSGGASTIQLADYESFDDSYYVGQTIYIYKGTGAGQTKTVTSYIGYLQTAQVNANWAPVIGNGSYYTSRPNLPRDAYDAYVYGVCSRLSEKYAADQFLAKRAEFLAKLKQAVSLFDRQDPGLIRDDYSHGDSGFGDPYDTYPW